MPNKQKERFSSIKCWLESNKVFFETIAAVLLTMMAIVVSIAQYKMMDKQNQISEANALPQIISTISYDKNEIGNYADEWIVTENEGGIIKEADTSMSLFIKASFTNLNNLRNKVLYIPLSGYYSSSFLTGRGKGTVAKSFGKDNNTKFHNFSLAFKPLMLRNNEMLFVDLVRIQKVKYFDIFGKNHVEYLVVAPIGGANALSKSEGERIFSAYNDALKNGTYLNFDKLNPNYFYQYIKSGAYVSWSIKLESK
jgi:hypothetical protein